MDKELNETVIDTNRVNQETVQIDINRVNQETVQIDTNRVNQESVLVNQESVFFNQEDFADEERLLEQISKLGLSNLGDLGRFRPTSLDI